jgi:hypothetical protein
MGVAYCALMATLGAAGWEGGPDAAIRVLLPMSFAFNLLVLQSRWFWPLVLLGNASALHGLQLLNLPLLSPYLRRIGVAVPLPARSLEDDVPCAARIDDGPDDATARIATEAERAARHAELVARATPERQHLALDTRRR